MGFVTRAVVPRSVRRAAHPVRTAKSTITPRPVKQARRVLNPVESTVYSAQRALNTRSRSKSGGGGIFLIACCIVFYKVLIGILIVAGIVVGIAWAVKEIERHSTNAQARRLYEWRHRRAMRNVDLRVHKGEVWPPKPPPTAGQGARRPDRIDAYLASRRRS